MQPQLPPLPLPRGSQWGLFYLSRGGITFHSLRNESGKIPKNKAHYVPQNRGNKKRGSLPVRNCVRFPVRNNKKNRQWFVTSSQSRNHASQWTSHRAEITLRGPRSRNIKKRLYRRVEMSDKGKVKKIRRLGNTVTFLISNKLPNKLPPST
jgi:hypothetical protein